MERRPRLAARVVAGGLTVAALAGLVLAACDGDSGTADPTTSSSSSSSSTPTTVDEETAVIEAYLEALDVFYEAANPPNPDHPRLAEVLTGEQLDLVRQNLTRLRDEGIAIRRGSETANNPRIVELGVRHSIVKDCAVDADVQFRTQDGEVIDDTVVEGEFTTRLVRESGGWKVSENDFAEDQCTAD